MTLYQAVKKCKQQAERYDEMAKRYAEFDGWFYENKAEQCRQESADYWQMMYWMQELAELKGHDL